MRSNRLRFLILLTALIAVPPTAFGQMKMNCSKVVSAGCASFNGMIDAHDTAILNAINADSTAARVCFVDEEDDFFIVSFTLPREVLWRKTKDGQAFKNTGVVTYSRYKQGVSDDSFFGIRTWTRYGEDGDLFAERKSSNGTPEFFLTPDEISLTRKWTNKVNTTTTFQLTIRTATGRYKETYDFKNEKGYPVETSTVGHCVRYEAGVYE